MVSNTSIYEYVKKHDPDRFLLSYFAPTQHRDALLTLVAFNQEIAKTREIVSETQIGLIRYQWWQDALEEIYQGLMPRKHHIVEPLAEIIKRYNLPHDLFKNLIYAREFDLEDRQPDTFDGLKTYINLTHMPFVELSACVLGEDANKLKDLSYLYGLIGLIRSIPHYHGQNRYMVPSDWLKTYDLKLSKLHQEEERSKLSTALGDKVGDITVEKPKHRYFKAMWSLSRHYLYLLEKSGYDAFELGHKGKKHRFFMILKLICGV